VVDSEAEAAASAEEGAVPAEAEELREAGKAKAKKSFDGIAGYAEKNVPLLSGPFLFWEVLMNNGIKAILIFLAVITLAAVITIFWGVGQYNSIITMDEQVKSQWAQVDNQLKRRYDLIPNLVETVKGYAKHESGVFTAIAEARTKYFQAGTVKDKIQSSQQLEGTLSRLLLLQETYPQLKANENFLKLQDSLEGTENRIAVERKRYNDDVRTLNTYRRSFTGRFIAAIAGVGEAQYYQIPEGQKEAPQVKFQ
jgi:LemA protein